MDPPSADGTALATETRTCLTAETIRTAGEAEVVTPTPATHTLHQTIALVMLNRTDRIHLKGTSLGQDHTGEEAMSHSQRDQGEL